MPSFTDIVERYDGTVGRFRQGPYIRRAKVFDPDGICHALSMKWIKHKKERTHFLRSVNSEEGFLDLLYIARLKRTEQVNCARKYLDDFGLRMQRRKWWANEVSLNEMANIATANWGFYFIGLTSRGVVPLAQTSGHALAVDNFRCKLFDPNGGQANFNDVDDLKKAFKLWIRSTYPDLRGRAVIEKYLPVR